MRNTNPDGLKRLATAVVVQAYRDLLDPSRISSPYQELPLMKPEKVKQFLRSPLFYTCCHLAELDPDNTREYILKANRRSVS